MKKALVFSLIFIGAVIHSIAAYSQTVNDPEVRFGVKLGGNVATVNFDSTVNQALNPGFVGGLSFQHLNHKNLGIQLEVNYFQGGWKENIDSVNNYQRRLHYLQVPFMTHARIGQGKTRMLLNFGPYFSVLLSDQKKINFSPEFPEQHYYRRDMDNIMEFGFCLGVGVSANTGIGLFQLEGRANYSLTNTFNRPPETVFITSNNLSAEVALSYFIEAAKLKSTAGKLLFWR
ncbi:MAG: porin family protein [Bacteroidota bacterium]